MNHFCNSLVHRFQKLLFQMQLNSDSFVKCPGKDFSRNRKLSFSQLIFLLVSMEGSTLSRELRRAFRFSLDHPSPSAFCQRRAKLLPSALPQCFKLFTESFPSLTVLLFYILFSPFTRLICCTLFSYISFVLFSPCFFIHSF